LSIQKPSEARLVGVAGTRLGALLDVFQAQVTLIWAQFTVWTRRPGTLIDLHEAADTPTSSDAMKAKRWVLALDRATRRGLFRPSCLPRALALQRLLRRHQVGGSYVRIGVRFDAGVLKAHAWVVCGDTVIDQDPRSVREFVPLADSDRLP
jgi:hypothetical protein